MAKRRSDRELNHDNWEDEDDAEESGSFSKAADDVIKQRVIKVARRRNPIASMRTVTESAAEEDEPEKPAVFGSFTGFGKSTIAPKSNAFGFLANLTSGAASTSSAAAPPKSNGNSTPSTIKDISDSKETKESKDKKDAKEVRDDKDKKWDEYYAKLKGLNEGVLDWVSRHVKANPLINLQPVFKDYDNYFAELEKLRGGITKESEAPKPLPVFTFGVPTTFQGSSSTASKSTAISTPAPTFAAPTPSTASATTTTTAGAQPTYSFGINSYSPKFGSNSVATVTSRSGAAVSFSAGSIGTNTYSTSGHSYSFGDFSKNDKNTCTSTTSLTKPTFSFGNPNSLGSADNKFSFTSASVGKPEKTGDEAAATENNDAEEEPPKAEFTPVVEEGHVYTIRCKVFVKKDASYGDRGVGNLYLKPVPDSEKMQLIVRADTNLGNLLCNFILSEAIPTQRMGKKDVMLVCLPTPDTKPPPVPILLRVKTSEDADDLLKTLEKYKK